MVDSHGIVRGKEVEERKSCESLMFVMRRALDPLLKEAMDLRTVSKSGCVNPFSPSFCYLGLLRIKGWMNQETKVAVPVFQTTRVH